MKEGYTHMPKENQVQIKICGLQTLEMIQSVVTLPLTYIGFVFAPSKRKVTPEQVGSWVNYVNSLRKLDRMVPRTVGVFVNPSLEELREVVRSTSIDVIQLHGQETPDFLRFIKQELGKPIIKSVSVLPSNQEMITLESVITQCQPYEEFIDVLLVDTHEPMYGGGSGKTFTWDCIPIYQQWANRAHVELFVAGGLHADNVHQLITDYHPHGVDVSSGVETDGVKDIIKIQRFVERVNTSDSRS